MAKDYPRCPNCNTEIKDGLMSVMYMLRPGEAQVINEFATVKKEGYCSKCGPALLKDSCTKLTVESNRVVSSMGGLFYAVPIVTSHSPYGWEYDTLGMVTGQSTTGTGVFTEISASFYDMFGGQSTRHNTKIKAGEVICSAQLRKQALDLGGNAVIATDIDYAEMGAEKGMIMVCMAGTAVKVTNMHVLGADRIEKIAELRGLNDRAKYLGQLSRYCPQ